MSRLLPSKDVKQLKVTLIKSVNKRTKKQKDSVRGLGLRKINHSVIVNNTPEIRGMLEAVSYLLKMEPV